MKTRYWILALLILLAAALFLLWPQAPRTASPGSPAPQTNTAAEAPASNQPGTSAAPTPATNPQPPAPAPVANPTTTEGRTELLKRALEGKNTPIDFYGRVVDQAGAPIIGVKITAVVRHWQATETSFSTSVRLEAETDANGNFHLAGATGDAFDIENFGKEGYLRSPKMAISYGPSTDPNNPAVLRMWKAAKNEPLTGARKVFGLDPGKTYTLDLVSGKKIEGEAAGDLRVLLERPAGVTSRDKYKWSFTIAAIGGGLLESNDEFMYLAPDSGYAPQLEMQFDPTDPAWTPIVKKRFFIRTRDGQVYGRVEAEIYSIYNVHSAINLSYTLNAAGSRNLQP